MTKTEIIENMIAKANEMLKTGWTRDKENELWTIANDNDIFMSEHYNDNDDLDGFYIEDDYWVFEF